MIYLTSGNFPFSCSFHVKIAARRHTHRVVIYFITTQKAEYQHVLTVDVLVKVQSLLFWTAIKSLGNAHVKVTCMEEHVTRAKMVSFMLDMEISLDAGVSKPLVVKGCCKCLRICIYLL